MNLIFKISCFNHFLLNWCFFSPSIYVKSCLVQIFFIDCTLLAHYWTHNSHLTLVFLGFFSILMLKYELLGATLSCDHISCRTSCSTILVHLNYLNAHILNLSKLDEFLSNSLMCYIDHNSVLDFFGNCMHCMLLLVLCRKFSCFLGRVLSCVLLLNDAQPLNLDYDGAS